MDPEIVGSSGTRKYPARRTRSPHPGVVILKPDDEHPYYRARFVDPDSGKTKKVTIDPVAVRTKEARRDWCIKKSRAIAKRRLELEQGAVRATGTAFIEAVERYFKDHGQLRDKTVVDYRAAAKKLVAWAEKEGIKSADDINRARLLAFRASLIKAPKLIVVRKGKRGERKASKEKRSEFSVNRDLRSARVILGYLAELDLLPKIKDGDLRRGLKKLAVSIERIEFLKQSEIRELLEAAMRHDADMYARTREEHAGLRLPGTTPRYEPIGPLVAFVGLTGMRFGEAMTLDWKQVDLDALDGDGNAVGEIHLDSRTKTRRARTVGLEVSPTLRRMLLEMRKHRSKGHVFGMTRPAAVASMKRLVKKYGARAGCDWKVLRATCGTFLTNSPGIFGASSAYRSAKQLGHSVTVAEKHYAGLLRGISRDARSLEVAMQIDEHMEWIIEAARIRAPGVKSA